MGSDATEAALGLLGLTGSIHFSAPPTATSTSTIPLKRKASSTTPAITTSFSLPPPSGQTSASTSHGNPVDDVDVSEGSDAISCICGFSYDDGFSIACDDCSRWVHAACFDIVEGEVPDEWRCWRCEPRKVDKERAVRLQRARQRQIQELDAERLMANGRRRVTSPGVDRRRRTSAATVDGAAATAPTNGNAKRKRRYSVNTQHGGHQNQQHHPQQQQQQQQTNGEDEHVDIDEPMSVSHTYIHLDQDLVPHQHTRDKLKRLAQHWRGVTALDSPDDSAPSPVLLSPDAFHEPPPTSLRPLPQSAFSHPTLSSNTNPYVRPQSYAVHTTQPIPSSSLIAPYTSTIVPSTVYLSDPLNSYAHLGMPKPFVHLIGPPLDVALDARLTGNTTRFVRSGCRPNAVLRPVLCHPREGDPRGPAEAEDSLAFGVFALRDLKAHEEVVLGWEWDDGSVIHHLPALIDSPHLFAPSHFEHFHYQMTSMLHALTSTFTTCACGAKATDCAVARLAEFVDGVIPPTPSPSPPTQHTDDGAYKGGHSTRERDTRMSSSSAVDLGPLVGVERGFRTRERVPMSGGMSGVEMVAGASGSQPYNGWESSQSPDAGPSKLPSSATPAPMAQKGYDRKGKSKAVDETAETLAPPGNRRSRRRSASPRPRSPLELRRRSSAGPAGPLIPPKEEMLPPKLRKKFIHKNWDALKEANATPMTPQSPIAEWRAPAKPPDNEKVTAEDSMDVDEAVKVMPPPPVPSSLTPSNSSTASNSLSPPAASAVSPTASFANLSLLSPLVNGPAPHFPGSFVQGSPSSSRSPSDRGSYFSTVIHTESLASPPSTAGSSVQEDPSILGSPFARRMASPVSPHAPDVPMTVETNDLTLSTEPVEMPFAVQTVVVPASDELNREDEDVPMEDQHDAQEPVSAPEPPAPAILEEENTIEREATPCDKNENETPGSPAENKQHINSPPMSSAPVPPSSPVPQIAEEKPVNLDAVLPPEKEHSREQASPEGAEQPVFQQTPVEDPAQSPPVEASPPPPPQPKVKKISLKDFALRKRRQREEEEKAHASATASPIVPPVPIAEEPNTEQAQSGAEPSVAEPVCSPLSQSPEAPKHEETRESPLTESSRQPSVAQESQDADVVAQAISPRLEISTEHMEETAPQDVTAPSSMTLETKVELLEARLPSRPPSVPIITTRSPSPISVPSSASPAPPTSRNKKENEPAPFTARSPGAQYVHHGLTRQLSQEDGEILSPPTAKPLPLAPRAHSPPTQPRGFHPHPGGTSSPSRPSQRRPLQPAAYRPQLQNMPISSRPLPSGPRALRVANSSSHYPIPANRPLGGPHHAPRAPSADRDRDRMDWDRDRGRTGPWSRGRGGGGWR